MNLREKIDGCIYWEKWLDGLALPEQCKNALESLIQSEKKAAVEQALALAYAKACSMTDNHGPKHFIDPIVSRLFPS